MPQESDIDAAAPASSIAVGKGKARTKRQWLALGALGVVYGDIGTSPLYTVRAILHDSHEFGLDEHSVYGAMSLVFWALVMIVCIKYMLVIMRASHHGEGGILTLLTLARSAILASPRKKQLLLVVGVLGATLFYGDALITPAISVLSAAEGLEVAAPSISHFTVPLTVAVLAVLFAVQRYGTRAVGTLFGPIMVIWFCTLGVLGVSQIAHHPGVLKAVNPVYGFEFLANNGVWAFLALGAVVLAVTGAEALFADMGHFGANPIRRAWFLLVFPALVLNYFGQGALLLEDPTAIVNPFFHLAPSWGEIPLVILATMATIIASQAVISGAFSLSRQAVRIGVLPLLEIRHTSNDNQGQVYLPAVNWTLFLSVVVVVVGFRSSSALSAAYGVAVTGTFITSTILVMVVARHVWHVPLWVVAAGGSVFLVIDTVFFAANVIKVEHGGWLPVSVALVLFIMLTTWERGQHFLRERRLELEGSLQQFVENVNRDPSAVTRVPGTAVSLSANDTTRPLAMRYNVLHNHVLHEQVVILTVETASRPRVPEDERIRIDDLWIPDDGITLVRTTFGYAEVPDVPAALRLAARQGLDIDVDHASYFLTRSTIYASHSPGMAWWRKRLFIAINRNAGNPTRYFNLPHERVVSMGSSITI